jgi:hypothetical protein
VRVVAWIALVLVGDSRLASAQNPRGRGPFAGLFGIGPQATNSQSLNVRASAFGVWQDVSFVGDVDPSLLDPTFQQNGTFGGTVGSMDYAFNRRTQTSNVYAAGQGWVADYSTVPDRPQYGANAMAGAAQNTRLTRRLTFQAAANAAYSPFFNLGPTPLTQQFAGGSPLPIDVTPGFGVSALSASNVDTYASIGLTGKITSRSAVYTTLAFQQVYFLDNPESNLTQVSSAVGFTHQLFKKLSFHAGYQEYQTRLRNPDGWSQPVRYLDFGLDYSDGLTLRISRRTTLALGASLGSARPVPGSTQYRVLGNANLTHTIGRTWYAFAGANRSLGFIATFEEPILSDTASVGLTGQLLTRLSWTTSATWLRGYIGLDSSRHYDSSSVGSTLSFALARRVGTFVQYTYYTNRLPAGASTLSALSNFDRQTVAAGLTLFEPIFNSQRTR